MLFGTIVFTDEDGFFWIPLVAPIIGGVIGFYLHKLLKNDFLSEFYGSFILVLIGLSISNLSLSNIGSAISGPVSWALALYFAAICGVNISGANFNPAVSIALAIRKKLEWKKVPRYLIA